MSYIVETMWVRWSREQVVAMILTLILTTAFIVSLLVSGGSTKIVVLYPLVAFLLIVLSSFELALALLVISLFVDFHALGFSSAVLFSIPFGLAFLLRFRDIKWREFTNPMSVPILVYGICILPSFINATKPLTSIYMLFNVVAFLVVMHGTLVGVRTRQSLRNIVVLYLGMALVGSFHLFSEYVETHSRVFGFAGIMFVDYSALGICIAVTMTIVGRGRQRVVSLGVALILTVAQILTQTRNTWLSTAITLAVLIGYLVFNPESVGLSRKRIITIALSALLLVAGSGALVISLDPKIVRRSTELTTELTVDERGSGLVVNSLVSRGIIWDTALNAFRAHPLVGIGVYAFTYSSNEYYTVSRTLYRLFAKDVSPHQTHLAVLTETGIIGALAFIWFLVVALRCPFIAIRQASEKQDSRFALVGAIATVYCSVSMVFTDAWLWGQGIVLLGLVIGLVMANGRINRASGSEVRA